MSRILILDLDDTIYPVKSIGREYFDELFASIDFKSFGYDAETVPQIHHALWREPMAHIAERYDFPDELIKKYRANADRLTFNFEIRPFGDYPLLVQTGLPMYLVTTGTVPVQEKKIDALNIRHHFKKILIDDPFVFPGGKAAHFREIIEAESILPSEFLVIGDNPDSEIAAARELGLNYLLLDRARHSPDYHNHIITGFRDLYLLLKK